MPSLAPGQFNPDSRILCDGVLKRLTGQRDSSTGKPLDIKKVMRVYSDPRDNLDEVLYLDKEGHPQTALIAKQTRELVSLSSGW